MTPTPERIKELCDRHLRVVGAGYVRPQDAEAFARAIEAEVRKDDEALIGQMLEALESADYNQRGVSAAIDAAYARLSPPPAP